ncbi:MAG: type IV secretory system conjugative DNA transfer family protein [Blastocatellia bacterium]
MSLDHFLKRIDAKYRLPRPANALHLDAYQAGFRVLRDVGEGMAMLACGVITAFIIWAIANILQATFETRIYFVFGMIIAVLISLSEALSLVLPYYRISQRLTHGSARWADAAQLRSLGLAHRTDQRLPQGALRLGRLTRKYDLMLPFERVICHTAIFGPPNSGKSASFIMSMAKDWARTGSAIFLDPKGELFKHTARHFRAVYRFDLAQPWFSDRWNFLPACMGDAELAHEVASIIVGFDANKYYNGDPFWPQAETALATGVLLHLPQIANRPTPAMLAEFLATRELKRLDSEMTASPDMEARIQWGIFKKADREKTQGGVFVGLGTKLAPLRAPHAMAVMQSVSAEDRKRGIREIDLRQLREPGTAIYVIVPEGDATRYRIVLSILFGLVASVVRKTSGEPRAAPVLMALDEAGNIPVHNLSEQLGVGRGRRCGIVLGYQNIGQVYKQYGHDGANAILGSVGTMVFLPGLDSETAQYAAKRIGRTTVLQHTSVDAPGSKFDNERDSEAGRDLLDAAELRQMVDHSQAVAITGSAPPVIFGFPPLSKGGPVAYPLPHEVARAIPLKDAEAAFTRLRTKEAALEASDTEDLHPARLGASTMNESDALKDNEIVATQSYQSVPSIRHASMSIDASAILGRVARNGIVESAEEANLNQPRSP